MFFGSALGRFPCSQLHFVWLQEVASASALEAANMLWLIQRDFLEGSSVQQMVNTALATVDNPRHDADIEEVTFPLNPFHFSPFGHE